MWGSDQTVFDHDYRETVDLIRATDRLDAADKRQILEQACGGCGAGPPRMLWSGQSSQPSAERASCSNESHSTN